MKNLVLQSMWLWCWFEGHVCILLSLTFINWYTPYTPLWLSSAVNVYYQGWPVPFLITTKEIAIDDEIVVDYGKKYWQCRNTEKEYFSAVLHAQEHAHVTAFRSLVEEALRTTGDMKAEKKRIVESEECGLVEEKKRKTAWSATLNVKQPDQPLSVEDGFN